MVLYVILSTFRLTLRLFPLVFFVSLVFIDYHRFALVISTETNDIPCKLYVQKNEIQRTPATPPESQEKSIQYYANNEFYCVFVIFMDFADFCQFQMKFYQKSTGNREKTRTSMEKLYFYVIFMGKPNIANSTWVIVTNSGFPRKMRKCVLFTSWESNTANSTWDPGSATVIWSDFQTV